MPTSPPDEIDVATIGEDVPLLEGLRTTRSIRRLRPDPVPRALVRKVCEAGTFAPSGGNRQPWIFVAVTEPARRAWVAERYASAFAGYLANFERAAAGETGVSEAARRNVLVTEGPAFAATPGTTPAAVRLCLSHEPDEARLRQGLETLRTILDTPIINSALIL